MLNLQFSKVASSFHYPWCLDTKESGSTYTRKQSRKGTKLPRGRNGDRRDRGLVAGTPDSSAASRTGPSEGGCVHSVCPCVSSLFSTSWLEPPPHAQGRLPPAHSEVPQTRLGPSLPHYQPSPPFLLTAPPITASLILRPALHSSSSLNLVAPGSREQGRGRLADPHWQEWKPLRGGLLLPFTGKMKAFGELSHT